MPGKGAGPRPAAPRPLRLLFPPEELRVLYAVPEGPPAQFVWRRLTHRVARFAGPERIAPEWWRDRPGARLRHLAIVVVLGAAAGLALGMETGTSSLGHPTGVFQFTPRFSDLDGDGWPDLAIAGDFLTSHLFWNNGDGTFTEGTAAAGVGGDQNGMGATIADYNGDGLLDWFVTSIYDRVNDCTQGGCGWGSTGNRLYLNTGARTFVDWTDQAGVRRSRSQAPRSTTARAASTTNAGSAAARNRKARS